MVNSNRKEPLLNFRGEPMSAVDYYWLGFMLGDGWIYHMKTQQCQIGLNIKDKSHLIKFAEYIDSKYYEKIVNGKSYWRTQKYSDSLAKWFISWGITSKKSLTATVDDRLVRNRSFWRGLFDADGHVGWTNKTPLIIIVGTYNIIENFTKYINPNSRAKILEKSNVFQYRLNSIEAGLIAYNLYKNSNIYLARKRNFVMQEFVPYLKDRSYVN